jgi:3-oxoacyl-[acyl-carrier protein] reductase
MSRAIQSVAVFGATGAIGHAITHWYDSQGHDVVAISRLPPSATASHPGIRWLAWDIGKQFESSSEPSVKKLNAVVWAQGVNFSDDIYSFDLDEHRRIYSANVLYVMSSLQALLRANLLAPRARLCVISSIWQNIARHNKMSYSVTKSALQGLVQSLSIDLGRSGYLINAVLPGALDTPMTRANVSSAQIERLIEMTPLGKLSTLDDVCNLVGFLCSPANDTITGQFVAVDGGFSHAKIF